MWQSDNGQAMCGRKDSGKHKDETLIEFQITIATINHYYKPAICGKKLFEFQSKYTSIQMYTIEQSEMYRRNNFKANTEIVRFLIHC